MGQAILDGKDQGETGLPGLSHTICAFGSAGVILPRQSSFLGASG